MHLSQRFTLPALTLVCPCGDAKPEQYDLCDTCQALSDGAVALENLDDERNLEAQRLRNVLNKRMRGEK